MEEAQTAVQNAIGGDNVTTVIQRRGWEQARRTQRSGAVREVHAVGLKGG